MHLLTYELTDTQKTKEINTVIYKDHVGDSELTRSFTRSVGAWC